jgi:hypothetical protein
MLQLHSTLHTALLFNIIGARIVFIVAQFV